MATKKKTTKKSAGSTSAQVAGDTTVKYGAAEQSLADTLSQAEDTYHGTVAAAHTTAKATGAAARAALPALDRNYAQAQGTISANNQTLADALSKVPNAGLAATAGVRDSAGTSSRLAETLADAKTEEIKRASDAAAGEHYADANARNTLAQARTKASSDATELAKEEGAFAESDAGTLRQQAAARRVTERGQTLSSQTADKNRTSSEKEQTANRKNAQTVAKINHTPVAVGPGTAKPAAVEKAKTALASARAAAKDAIGGYKLVDGQYQLTYKDSTTGKTKTSTLTRAQLQSTLAQGRPSQTIKNNSAGNPLANPITSPAVKAQPDLYASVALDEAMMGHVSAANAKRLHALGLSVAQLGLTSATQAKANASPPARPPAALTGPLTPPAFSVPKPKAARKPAVGGLPGARRPKARVK